MHEVKIFNYKAALIYQNNNILEITNFFTHHLNFTQKFLKALRGNLFKNKK